MYGLGESAGIEYGVGGDGPQLHSEGLGPGKVTNRGGEVLISQDETA